MRFAISVVLLAAAASDIPGTEPKRATAVSVVAAKFHINGVLTYKGRTWNGKPIAGLLLNRLEVVVPGDAAGPLKFAEEEIHREAKVMGTWGDDPKGNRVVLTVGNEDKTIAQSYSIRVEHVGGRRTITVSHQTRHLLRKPNPIGA